MKNDAHDLKIERIRDQVRRFNRLNEKVKIYHGSTNSLRKQDFTKNKVVDISDLNKVLDIDRANKVATVEPNVPMDKLVNATLKLGLVPLIVPEFPGITVGGAIQGGATESSAFKYGGFHDICTEHEIVLGNGRVITATAERNADLFKNIPCTYGTVGIVTKTRIKLRDATKFVALRYEVIHSFDDAHDLLLKACKETVDFVDGIMFLKDFGVVITGIYTDNPLPQKSTFHRFRDEWFYLHAEKISRSQEQYEEIVPLKDYLFRYDRGAFWMARYVFKIMHTPFNRLTRTVFSPFCTTRFLYRQLHASNYSQKFLVQDLCMPEHRIADLLGYVNQEINCYPLWLLPINATVSTNGIFCKLPSKSKFSINVGVWTEVEDFERFIEINRKIEAKVKEFGGIKTLYAHSYYSFDEFWSIYDREAYIKLRRAYGAEKIFPDIYSKVVVKERYRQSISKAVLKLGTVKLPLS